MAPSADRPQNGAEYLATLRDGRRVWIRGERAADVTAHPAFRGHAHTVAGLYDALHDPARRDALTAPTDTGSPGRTHPFFLVPRSVDDLRAARRAIVAWQRPVFGWLGRSPDYKAAFLATLGADPGRYGPFADNARAWYARSQERVLFFAHALVNPPVDKHLPGGTPPPVAPRVERETDAGIVVTGAKVVATGAACAQYVFVAHTGPPLTDPALAVAFVAPLDAPGLTVLCRPSHELAARAVGTPFDQPLSSRLDENDAVLVFDRVLIPWENVLVHRDTRRANAFLHESGFLPRFLLHGATRLGVKLDFLCGLLLRATRMTGGDAHAAVRAAVGEALAWRHAVWALGEAMVAGARPAPDGSWLPDAATAHAHRVLGPGIYRRTRDLIEDAVGGALCHLPSHASDFAAPELRPLLDTYLRGSHGTGAEERAKLMKLLWDAIGSEFAGRHVLYERQYAGSSVVCRLDAWEHAQDSGLADELGALVDNCLSGYDLRGWTA
ncbi:4-hydroxyphenylacetate 3-hydroxylase family protein [Streptomyces radicis]|uniref:Pyoverdin chromophore biosynthetic protein pvcC n=1 Tax=Streptomyces radicis TaxID=1750517 RepID=A0A3A9WKT2_9ACTN|nr:4-hydroxyphenylacetate 3-hydroxylase N-terminal domain-containing protein [Streptomyces radicis]RKN08346.1 Pyoverdin chromophore biosynthetic protein pvcC [Streptomyces radicis]RKN21618.1 Pyoverdin chromophore biosynthetic protein pvcC [Streptomyces radicis]